MTDEEYIKNISSISTEKLFNLLEYYGYDSYYADLLTETIEELKKRFEERPTGHWEALGFVHSRRYAWCTCSNCGKTTKIYLDNNDFCCIADIRNKAVACLFCGADMRKETEND